jgi:hypothetical protein
MNFTPVLVLMICAAPLAARGADLSSTGPLATAQQIRSAHVALSAPGHRIIFDVIEKGKAAHEKVVLVVTADYFDVSRSSTDRLYDFGLRRILTIDHANRRFTNTSLYALAGFRVIEAQNRAAMRHVLGAAAKSPGTTVPSAVDPFWAASELGVAVSKEPIPDFDRQSGPKGTLAFSYRGQEVAQFSPSAWQLPSGELARFGSFLRIECPLNPEIVSSILATGRLPKSLSFEWRTGTKATHVVYELVSVEAGDFTYPLPAEYHVNPLPSQKDDVDSESMRQLLPVMLEAVALRYRGGPRSASDYETAIDQELAAGHDFHALLLAIEMVLQHGASAASCRFWPAPKPCRSIQDVFAAVGHDERAQKFIEALRAEQAAHDVGKAIRIRRELQHEDVANGYIVDDQLANALTSTGSADTETFALFSKALYGNPYVATFYKDIGDYFMRRYHADLAWLCYDLGRLLPDSDATPVLRSVTSFEQQLAAEYPQFF